jgi:hypothetical protein
MASDLFPLRAFPTLARIGGALAFATLSAGCSSNSAAPPPAGSDAGCTAFVPPASFNPSSPTYSFSNDVMPIFEASCAFTSCHGSIAAPQAGMYLGSNAADVYANIVGVTSTQYPSMKRPSGLHERRLRRAHAADCNITVARGRAPDDTRLDRAGRAQRR